MSKTPVMPDPRPAFARAAEQLGTVIAAVRPEQFGLPTPCVEYDVRALLGHLVAGADRIANAGEGKSSDGPDVPAWTPDLPEDGWPKAYRDAWERTAAVWADDAKLDAPTTVPWGRMPGQIAMAGAVMETVVHTWDLARAVGWDGELDPELGEFALATAHRALPGEDREHLPFGEARQAPEDADVYGRLAAWVGREPEWKGTV